MHAPPSSRVVVAAPMSFAGSAQRLWKLTGLSDSGPARAALGLAAVLLIMVVWAAVLCWYLIFGLLLVPYRIVRRGQRKDKRAQLQHAETLQAIRERDSY